MADKIKIVVWDSIGNTLLGVCGPWWTSGNRFRFSTSWTKVQGRT